MRERCPWREAERRFFVEVRPVLLPDECGGGAMVLRDGTYWLMYDPRRSPVEQRCIVAHELVHLDRGSSLQCLYVPRSVGDCVSSEERRVDEEVARWLVPDEDLWDLVSDMVAGGEDVTVRVIAAEFGVTKPIARIAIERFARSDPRLREAG